MLRWLSDENFNGPVLREVLRRESNLDLVRVQDVGLSGADDPTVLAWAADHDRVVLTSDQATMPDAAYDRINAGLTMPGVFILSSQLAIGHAIQEILLVNECSTQSDWTSRVTYLPL